MCRGVFRGVRPDNAHVKKGRKYITNMIHRKLDSVTRLGYIMDGNAWDPDACDDAEVAALELMDRDAAEAAGALRDPRAR